MCTAQYPELPSSSGYHAMPFNDLWICPKCGTENADWNNQCPNCEYVKDQLSHATFTSHHTMHPEAFTDVWTCNECGANNLSWCNEQCPVCGSMRGNSFHQPQATDPSDLWICPECGAENGDWCDHCPLCSYVKNNAGTVQLGAGSAAPGSWICAYCGGANSAVHGNQCGQCGEVN
jgi:rubrerythrin